ncbi:MULTISPECIES: hypothetical protein [unclassified Agrococcus]|uniref:hypothetical protein n=1 Tax=unclassified Agrococcus TaxID=2615065 RepID=UPI0036090A4C
MTGFAERAEQIAAHLVGHATGASVTVHDRDGRQSAVDYILEWPDGRRGALEVTLVIDPTSIEWQGKAAKERWRWPAGTSWDFRPAEKNFHYKRTRQAVLRAVQLCDAWAVDTPADLPAEVLAIENDVSSFLADQTGTLRRSPFSAGVTVYPCVRAEFRAPTDFSQVVESWHVQPHLASHIEKVRKAPDVTERHLFLVPLDDVLPEKFFTDDFEVPQLPPQGFGGVDALWFWSNYWHRCLVFSDQEWRWLDLP